MSIFAQFKYNGLLYTLKVQPTKEFPSNEVPYDKQLTEQFKDIAQNHAALAVEEADRPNVYRLAQEQVDEYNRERRK